MKVQFIESNGNPEYAIIPYSEYNQLLEQIELAQDTAAYLESKHDDDELIPGEIVDRLLAGENKIKVWREFRGLSQTELSNLTGIPQPTLSLREKSGFATVSQYKKLAKALNLDIGDLIP